MNSTRHPGDAEAQAAIAALPEQTISRSLPKPGQHVRVPRAFGGGYQVGIVSHIETDRHLGHVVRVDTQEGRLVLLPDECEAV